MSISYALNLTGDRPATVVAVALIHGAAQRDVLRPEASVGGLLGPGVHSRSGLWIRMTPVRPSPRDPVVAELGLLPTVETVFQLGSSETYDEQIDDALFLIGYLIDWASDADAVVVSDAGNTIPLLRRNGGLMIDADWWRPEQQRHLRQPFQASRLEVS